MSTKFQDYNPKTPITADWLNSVDDLLLNNFPAQIAAVQANLDAYKGDLADTVTLSKGAALIGRGIQVVGTAAALRNLLKISPSNFAMTAGYWSPGDGGEAFYYLDEADVTSADNGGTVFVAADGGRWKLVNGQEFNIRQFGARPDGPDAAAAIQAAITACLALGKKKLIIPAGIYFLNSALNVAMTGISGFALEGAGSTVTELRFVNGTYGISCTASDGNWWLELDPTAGLNFKGFTLSTTANGLGVGMYLQMGCIVGRPPKRVMCDDIEWRGVSGFSQSWAQCTSLFNTADVWFNNCRWVIGGPGFTTNTGVNIAGTPGNDPAGFYFNECEALYGNIWINAGSNVEGIYLTQCSHVAGGKAVQWIAGAESGLHVIGGHYNNFVGNFDLQGVFDFVVNGALLYSEGHDVNTFIHVYSKNGGRGTVTNCVMNSGGTGQEHGVYIENSAGGATYGTTVADNSFNGLKGYGVVLQATAQYVSVGFNGYNGCVLGDVLNNTLSLNRVERRRYEASIVVTLTGGAITETINIGIPAGVFRSKPDVGMISGEGIQCIGFYDQPSGTSTATNMKVDLRKLDGVNFSAGPIRLSLYAAQ